MIIRHTVFLSALLFGFCAAAQDNPGSPRSTVQAESDKSQLPATYVPSGKSMFKQYCAACHGADAKGRGPATPTLNMRVPDLTTLSKRHDGKFPYEYVESVLRFGPGFAAHGSADMPVWGPIFQYLENYNEAAVRQRIKNLCDYLESIQQK
jgi:mono/diheme cytochrome c family protein